jgi:hypothetical protein
LGVGLAREGNSNGSIHSFDWCWSSLEVFVEILLVLFFEVFGFGFSNQL